MVYNGIWTASFLHIIKAFNFDLGGEELFYFCNILHKCYKHRITISKNPTVLLVDTNAHIMPIKGTTEILNSVRPCSMESLQHQLPVNKVWPEKV